MVWLRSLYLLSAFYHHISETTRRYLMLKSVTLTLVYEHCCVKSIVTWIISSELIQIQPSKASKNIYVPYHHEVLLNKRT